MEQIKSIIFLILLPVFCLAQDEVSIVRQGQWISMDSKTYDTVVELEQKGVQVFPRNMTPIESENIITMLTTLGEFGKANASRRRYFGKKKVGALNEKTDAMRKIDKYCMNGELSKESCDILRQDAKTLKLDE